MQTVTSVDDLIKEPVTKKRKYACDSEDCNATFKRLSHLNGHKRTHSDERPYACDFEDCNAAFKRRDALNAHKRNHINERPYACDFEDCNATFKILCTLNDHKRTHSVERPYACDFEDCNAAFKLLNILNVHKLTHSDERPYVCDFEDCNAAFKRRNAFDSHKRTHSDERPYVCDFEDCNAAFKQSSSLTKHKRIHTGEQPYVCDFEDCNTAFKQSSSLITHKRTHSGELPYKCGDEHCTQQFASSGTRNTHFKRWHTEEGIRRHRLQEERIEKLFIANEIPYTREVHISYSCFDSSNKHRAKLDFVVPTDRAVFIVEIDEHSHDNTWDYTVSCEQAKMSYVETALTICADPSVGRQPTVWLRYNPDTFKIDGKTVRTFKKDREEVLLRFLRNYVPTRPMTIMYLYYGCHSGPNGEWAQPTVLDDEDYSDEMKQFVEIVTQSTVAQLVATPLIDK